MTLEYYHILTPDGELYHYGVKGMKWGVRRTPEQLGRKTPTQRKRKETDSESNARLFNRIKNLDNDGRRSLDQEIRAKSGDWYEHTGVSKRFKQAIKDYDSEMKELELKYTKNIIDKAKNYSQNIEKAHSRLERNIIEKKAEKLMREYYDTLYEVRRGSEADAIERRYHENLASAVLLDLGYKDTPEARRFLLDEHIIVWD